MAVGVHHVIDGPDDGPVVVLSGSIGSTTAMWDEQVPPLVQAGFRVVRVDHRGHGGSPAPDGPYSIADLADDGIALLDTLGVAQAHWVGLSLGAMTGLWLAAHNPERLGRLVALNTAARIPPRTMWTDRAATVTEQGMAAIAQPVVSRWLTAAGHAARPDLVARLEAMVSAQPPAGYAACCHAIADMDLGPMLARVAVPTLVIAGADDVATPVAQARRLVHGIPGARLAIVEQAAHLGVVERPEPFARLIVEHLTRVEPSRGEIGEFVRRAVLGDAHVDAALAEVSEHTAAFQRHITENVWGAVWTRDALDLRTRSAVTLAVLVATRAHDEIAMHVRGALRNGLTPAEISEIVLHTSAYAGAPAARSAYAIVESVLAENPH